MNAYVSRKTLKQKNSEWLTRIAPFNTHNMKLDGNNAALMVIDMQTFFLDPQSPSYTCGGPAIIPNLQKLITAFRNAGRPVIFTRHVHHPDRIDAGIMEWWWEGICIDGSPESQIHPDIAPLSGEKIIKKHRYSAFYNTDLETILRCLQIGDIVITGIMTNMCCETTARDAFQRDHRVFFVSDGTGSINEEMHVASLLNLAFGFASVVDTDTTIRQLTDVNI